MQSISQVRLYDGSVYTGTVEDIDVHSDLATVRINKVHIFFYIILYNYLYIFKLLLLIFSIDKFTSNETWFFFKS